MDHMTAEYAKLILGWVVDGHHAPKYWTKGTVKAGAQKDTDLVTVSAADIDHHTAILGASGSGKSAFLGRLVEEIILLPKPLRCLIFDPNADFRKVHDIQSEDLWVSARYDPVTRSGKLPHESSRIQFSSRWPIDDIAIRSRTGGIEKDETAQSLQISWRSAPIELLAEDIPDVQRGDLWLFHVSIRAIVLLRRLGRIAKLPDPENDLFDDAEYCYRKSRTLICDGVNISNFIWDRWHLDDVVAIICADKDIMPQAQEYLTGIPITSAELDLAAFPTQLRQTLEDSTRVIARAATEVAEDVAHYYISKARYYSAAGIVEPDISSTKAYTLHKRLEVIDLPSLEDRPTMHLIISALIAKEWKRVKREWENALRKSQEDDTRLPTFIIVDEAHNLLPAEPRGAGDQLIIEQFRRIVSEGRKYGLFLILATQRPDKLDPFVLAECENVALFRLPSKEDFQHLKKMLAIDVAENDLSKIPELTISCGYLFGPWVGGQANKFFACARRTVEGGRSLRRDYWAKQ